MVANPLPIPAAEVEVLEQIEKKVLWLSTYMIHHANKIRPNPDRIKVGGHQASTASVVSLLTALMAKVMTPHDRLALKPHSSPALHALQVLLGNLAPDKLKEFRQFGGIQSYPNRQKDPDEVHFNTGSVGLGGVNAMFGAVVQEYAASHFPGEVSEGRYISIIGDAEMEEGTLYEALVESQNTHLHNCWWIIDYNRQSLDKLQPINRMQQMQDIFTTFGWEVIIVKYSRDLQELFKQPGGPALKQWFDDVSNAEYQALLRVSADAYKAQLLESVGGKSKAARALIEKYDGEHLRYRIMHLAGHDMHMILDAFQRAAQVHGKPVVILAYTIKGFGLPLAGHKDNHSGVLTDGEIASFRDSLDIKPGQEFDPFAGLKSAKTVKAYLKQAPLHASHRRDKAKVPPPVEVPTTLNIPYKPVLSTQAAFGQIIMELSRVRGLSERIVTTSPDVAISTNLGGWINRSGIYQPERRSDFYEQYDLKSPFQWKETPAGKHLELGIAENNFFSLLGVLGMSHELNGGLLLPIGTVYDVFLKRGLDMLTNAIYSGSKFILVGTPSGVTLAPEGGAHQSFLTPLLGLGFPDLLYYEPAHAKELEVILCWALKQLQDRQAGKPVYLRLSTNPVDQPPIEASSHWQRQVIEGASWLRDYRTHSEYRKGRKFLILSTGVMVQEALKASTQLAEEGIFANVITISSPGRLYENWTRFQKAALKGEPASTPYLWDLVPPEDRHPVVSVIDGHPLTLEWLGQALGVPQMALGVSQFGESGDIASLYRRMDIHADNIVDAVGWHIVRQSAGGQQAHQRNI